MSVSTTDISGMRVAVIGLGSIGNRHLTNLAALGVRQRVVVRRTSKANSAFQPPEDVSVFHDAETAIAAGLDAALICTPTSMHLDSAMPFLQADVPVLIEKPIEANLAAACKLAELADTRNVYASVAYCLRHHPVYRTAYDFVQSGELGIVRSATATLHTYLPDWHPYEDYRQSYAARADLGGGVIPTLDHEIDFLLWTLGPGEITRAQLTSGQDSLGIDVPAAAQLQLAHVGSATSEVSLSFANRSFSRGFEFQGTGGQLSFDFASGELCVQQRENEKHTTEPTVLATAAETDINAMYVSLLRQTLVEIASGMPASTPLSAGVAALQICQQAKDLAAKNS